MGRVGGNIGEEGALPVLLDELQRLLEEDVGAVARVWLGLSVVLQYGVEIGSFGRIGRLADAAALVDHRLLEALVHGPEWVVVPQVPLAEDAGPVTRRRESLGQCDLVRVHHGPSHVRVHHPGPVVVAAGHEAGPGGSADGRDVEASQLHALCRQAVQVGRAEDVVAMASQLGPALVVGDDENDVGPAGFLSRGR